LTVNKVCHSPRARANRLTAKLGLPLLGDYLEEGLAMFNESCDDFNARL
jgi:hypothetical protein